MKKHLTIIGLAALLVSSAAQATPGGLNAEGCHNDRKGGTGYHCHRGQPSRDTASSRSLGLIRGGGDTDFANCSAARAAGAAPVREGSPGYSRKLDRDGDGVGCE